MKEIKKEPPEHDVLIINAQDYISYGDDMTTTIGPSDIGTITIGSNTPVNYPLFTDTEDLLDRHSMNKLTVDHKVTAHELLKLKESVPDYADEIKNNIAKKAAQEVSKKMTYTKKQDVESDTHHFIGRVWVFTEEELKQLIEEARNV